MIRALSHPIITEPYDRMAPDGRVRSARRLGRAPARNHSMLRGDRARGKASREPLPVVPRPNVGLVPGANRFA